MKLFKLLTIFFLFCFSTTFGSEKNINDYRIQNLKDIPSKDVNCIFHDSKGFMWIGTLDGLHRFDGYSYKTYRISTEKNSISSNLILLVDEDSKGNIWIATYGKGLCKLDPKTETFTSYENLKDSKDNKLPNDISAFIIDDNDYLWIGTWFGLLRAKMDSTMSKFIEVEDFHSDNQIKSDQGVKTIFQDKEKNIWFGTKYFITRIISPYTTSKKINFERFSCHCSSICDFENGILIGGNQLKSCIKDKDGSYSVRNISSQSAIKILYKQGQIWSGQRTGLTCLEKDDNGEWKITKQLQKDFTDESLSSNISTALISDDVGQIWLGTRGGGVDIISQIPNRFQHYKHTKTDGSLSNDLVMCMFEDSNENLWIGTEEKGVNFLQNGKNYSNSFINIQVNSFINEDRVYAIEETRTPASKDHKSIIWLGTSHYKFLAAFNPETLKEITLPSETSNIGYVFSMESQDDSILWVGTYSSGLWRLKLDTYGNIKEFKNFTPETDSRLLSYIIRSIFKDSKGNIWIGTDKGINLITKKESVKEHPNFKSFSLGNTPKHLSHDYILQITESLNGTIWIGTMGGGLLKYERLSDDDYSISSITTNDGLPNNTIKSVVEDTDGYLWITSNKGLSKYNPFNGNIINYDKEDGLQDNDFSEICGLRRKSGEIVLGGINGVNVFRPGFFKIDENKPRLYFTDFFILNKEIGKGDSIDNKIILENTIEYTHSITLDYNHNSFSIGFAGIQYNSPQKNNYRYILEGFDKEWYKASPDYRIAKYTNVPDGEYTFKVMGSNSDNIWTDKPIELKIKIKSPGYRTPLAITIYLVLLIILTYIIYRVIHEITQRKRDLLIANIEKDRVEEIAKLKLQFFTNISHEFRTPLSLITTPLDQLIHEGEKVFTKNQLYNLNLIKHNVGVMMRLINQLLDFRRLDQNKLKIQPSRQSLNEFLENIFRAFEVLASQKNIEYNFIPYSGGDDIWIDVDKMEKVIYNLLSNAFKYTGENGTITIRVDADLQSNQYVISVTDTGIGIEKDEEIHIFERYYQADNRKKRNISGTGIGLALAKGFVDLHQGEIGFYPNTEEGTVFFVKLKMGNAHFTQDMLVDPQEMVISSVPKYVSPVETNTDDTENHENKTKLPQMLVVEDNFELRKQIKNIFRSDYRIIEADDGLEGLKLCKQKLPDIVVTDVMMPNMDGMEMCDKIKSDEEISHIPILILTAKNSDETIIESYELGADGYVAKPFNIDVIKARVYSLVKNREQLRSRFQKEIEINPNIISNTPADAKFLEKILALIEKNLPESDYTVEHLATDYGVSRIYLNRKVKALTGETTIEFMRNIKLKHAAELLKQNKLTVSEVAWEVGYADLRTFRKRFKEKFEQSPSEFAKQYK